MINIWTQNRMKITLKSYITINCIIVMFFCYINGKVSELEVGAVGDQG